MDGFALLDEGKLEGVEVLDAPALGDASRLTRYAGTDGSGRSFERVRLTFVIDRLVGSVAFYWYDEARAEALAPDAMVEPAGVLLARMQSVLAGDAPNLPGMIVRLDPTAELEVEGHLEGYYVLDGRVVPWEGDTLASLGRADDFQQQWGVVAEYSARTAFVPQSGGASHPFYLVHLFRLESSADAAALVREHAQYDETLGYTAMAELESLPPVDGAVAGVSYTAPWEDGSENEGFRIWFQVGATVVVMEASDLGGVEDALMFQLVERQAACLEFGSCAPIPAPFPGPGPSATPAA
jgi:hypothetical protein